MRRGGLILGSVVALLLLPACVKRWDLRLSEVGKRNVEIYLDEPPSEALNLRNFKLSWSGAGGLGEQLDLGAFGQNLPGGGFLIVWEQGGYTGPPVAASFSGGQTGAVPGIKVKGGFFDQIDNVAAEVLVEGSRNVALFVTHKVSDVVRFGSPVADRPATGGSFRSDGNLTNPSGSASLQRKWSGGAPRDTDAESDWLKRLTSWGVPTP